jgi:hypothetical protein
MMLNYIKITVKWNKLSNNKRLNTKNVGEVKFGEENHEMKTIEEILAITNIKNNHAKIDTL